MNKWLTYEWYQYLFEKPYKYSNGYCSWLTRFLCRIEGHSCGPIYYNPGALEPDTRCINCGDNIG